MNLSICGDKRIRTADICRAKAALYQLSYTPISLFRLSLCVNKLIMLPKITMAFQSLKGGDPTAPSSTVTLLRLHPSH